MSDGAKPETTTWKFAMPPQPIEMVEHMNGLMAGWMRRRQEALATGIQALQQMAASPDPTAAARTYADWMGGSFNRIRADIDDAAAHTLRMAALTQSACQTVSEQAVTTMVAAGEQARTVQPLTTPGALREAA